MSRRLSTADAASHIYRALLIMMRYITLETADIPESSKKDLREKLHDTAVVHYTHMRAAMLELTPHSRRKEDEPN